MAVVVPIVAMIIATPIVAAIIVTPIVAAIVLTIVAMLIAIAVAIVGLRRRDDAARKRDRNNHSSEQTFHFDLPD
jgi:ABC-type transport system involved in cytochrome bd biosynthesis fused ATPase/permease subunit